MALTAGISLAQVTNVSRTVGERVGGVPQFHGGRAAGGRWQL
jgi:hypothetical protein